MKNTTLSTIVIILGLYISCTSPQRPPNNNYLNEESPGQTAKLFGRGVISTDHYEHGSPAFSPSYDEIYWGIRKNSEIGREIIEFVRREGNVWSKNKIPSFSMMGKGDLYPTFSKDGKEIYFTSDRSDPSKPEIKNRCIWKVQRDNNKWSKPENVGFDALDIYGLSISQSGALYFMAQAVQDRGTMIYDIYYSRLENGKYIKPEKIGYPISTEHYEDNPFISSDGQFLLFESNRPDGYGSTDIYLSFKTKNGDWSQPQNLRKLINSESAERFPYISPDGNYFFFGSNRTGNYDIYWIDASVIYQLLNH